MTASMTRQAPFTAAVWEALRHVDDPEYPGLSIVDLGLVESVSTADSHAVVGLIPTFSGCPALRMIGDDVVEAVQSGIAGTTCTVEWLPSPVWSTDRLTDLAWERLASAYTVILRSKSGALRCPVCGSEQVVDQSVAGPTRCRSVAWCESCRNPVEVMR